MAAVKTSPPHSSASSASSPEATTAEQAQFPTQKRKGGRKPVYATQEERKMRNRAAQAAFRERRTEYIKHLEATIKHHEETLSSLQQSSRNAADEVLMLRYKNSLLERILLEKGIDVTAELRAFAQYDDTGRPQAAPQQTMPQSLSRQQPIQQHPALRPIHGGPIIQKRPSINPPPEALYIKTSPLLRPNHSRTTSPSIAIPTPPDQSFQIPHSTVTTPTAPQDFPHPGIPMGQNFYPSPFQSHMEELGKLPRTRNTTPSFSKAITTIPSHSITRVSGLQTLQ
ncbi:hypothetical protein P167DRAFT_431125 [Morchella conica CCBAS932]|uniref:BZIP domain-containing protein n=1 Tax=Morchella conica CCBAS932 TaxID=1392247 RepID=A0A3N4L483_9PEZI|nr:hypothetical protein P167DRAFT_431125 [Morchella conica CCBAS932]